MLFEKPIFKPFLLFLLLLAGPAAANETAELHVIGVYEGNIRTDGVVHGPEVRAVVDRGDVPVILSLSSYEPVRWRLTTRPGTRVETIYISGYQPERSEIFLNDIQVMPIVLPEGSYAYKPEGVKFRSLISLLASETGLERLSSFSGSYSAPEEGFAVVAVDDAPELGPDHLRAYLRPDLVPAALRPYLADRQPDSSGARMTNDGFAYLDESGVERSVSASLDVPRISWPAAAAMDRDGGRIFGVTYGGEGFIYQYDMGTETWSVLASMQNMDAAGMIYDGEEDRLILGVGLMGTGLAVFDRKRGLTQVPLKQSSLPGLTDLYDPGNGPATPLLPIAVSGDMVLATADGRRFPFDDEGQGSYRTYLVDLRTGEAALVAYRDAEK